MYWGERSELKKFLERVTRWRRNEFQKFRENGLELLVGMFDYELHVRRDEVFLYP